MTLAPAQGEISHAVGAVEAKLAELFVPAPGKPPRMRASTMNWIVLGEPTSELVARIDALGTTHPSRALLLDSRANLPPFAVEAEVEAVCRDYPGGDLICSERVVLRLGREAATRAVSIVTALSLADLPTVVMALPDASEALPLEALQQGADRLIVDSRGTSLAKIAAQASDESFYLADLGWNELYPWRDLTARLFDDPAWLPMLAGLEGLEIRHAAEASGEAPHDVRLYVGWLASRLGATLTDEGKVRLGDHELAIELVPEAASPKGAGSLLSVLLRGRIDDSERRATIERLPEDSGFACSKEGGPEPARNLFRLIARDEEWLLSRALDSTLPDRVLREAVRWAAGWQA